MKALVVAGAGLHGAYQVGVLETLIKRDGYAPDIMVGCSVGSTTVASLSYQGFNAAGIDQVKNAWLGLRNLGSIFGRNWSFPLGSNGFYNGEPLRNLIGAFMNGKTPTIPYAVTVCDFKKGKTAYFTAIVGNPATYVSDLDGALLTDLDCIEASYSIPIALNLFQNRWADGGVDDTAPCAKAIAMGADDITVILGYALTEADWTETNPNMFDVAERTVDIATQGLLNDDILMAQKAGVKLRIIQPTVSIPLGMLTVDPTKIRETILIGNQAV